MGIRTRPAVVAGAALVAFSALGTPAHAGLEHCGKPVYDYGKIEFIACLYNQTPWQPVSYSYQPAAQFNTVSPTTPSLWTACVVNINLFINGVQRTIYAADCLSSARNNSRYATFYALPFTAEPGNCYRTVAKWTGTYNNSAVGSHVNAESNTICR